MGLRVKAPDAAESRFNQFRPHVAEREMEVFPVEIALKGEAVWLGWVSPDDGDASFLTKEDRLIFSCNGSDSLMWEVTRIFPGAQFGVASFFDLDSIVGKFSKSLILEGDFALDVWNLLTDLYHTFGGTDTTFSERHVDVYRRLFSHSESAPIVGVRRVRLSTRDMEVVREVLLEGVELFAQRVEVAKAARSLAT